MSERVLVIKHGALGDLVLATGPFAAIRQRHPAADMVLLTTPAFAGLAQQMPWFDAVWPDDRPGLSRPGALLALARRLRNGGFTHVYDLQTSDRSSLYLRFFRRPKPFWSGIARGASHPHANPARDGMHTLARQRDQLQMAGIADVPAPDLNWLDADIATLAPTGSFALLVPGGSAHRPAKRWPGDRYAALAGRLLARGIAPLLLGAAAERGLLADIAAAVPGVRNLGGQTGFGEIAALARRASVAIGNDTGPMHIIAAAGCRSVVLFSGASDPALCAPVGPAVRVLRREPLGQLAVDEVMTALS